MSTGQSDLDEAVIEAIKTIGNHPKCIKMTEPQVAFPLKLENWMIKRVMCAEQLFKERMK